TRIELAELNLRAGTRALDTAAYDAALRYLDTGLAQLAGWREAVGEQGPSAPHYALIVGLEFVRAQVLALGQQLPAAAAAFERLLAWPLDITDFGRIAARRVRLLTLEGRPLDAVEFGLATLARC